jgi:hypothetical protein
MSLIPLFQLCKSDSLQCAFCTQDSLNIFVRSLQEVPTIQVHSDQWRTQEFCSGGVQQIQLRTEDRERGSGGGSPLVRGSGGSCNLVQDISFHIVNLS